MSLRSKLRNEITPALSKKNCIHGALSSSLAPPPSSEHSTALYNTELPNTDESIVSTPSETTYTSKSSVLISNSSKLSSEISVSCNNTSAKKSTFSPYLHASLQTSEDQKTKASTSSNT